MQGIVPYVARRLLWAPLILLAVSFIAFMVTRFGPGDPISVAQGQFRDPEALARVKAELGLDKPFYEQYAIYMRDLVLHGDLGDSYRYRDRSVSELIFPRMWVSAQLGLIALAITFAVGIPVGILAALRQGTWADPTAISTFLLFQSVPVLVTIPLMLLVFVVKLDWLPTGGWGCPIKIGALPADFECIGVPSKRLIIPALALSLPGIAGVARLAVRKKPPA